MPNRHLGSPVKEMRRQFLTVHDAMQGNLKYLTKNI